jgi:hypothetical protein
MPKETAGDWRQQGRKGSRYWIWAWQGNYTKISQ